MFIAIIKWLILTPILWVVQLLTYPLAPIAAYFSDSDGRLLKMFRWMETHDNLGWSGPLSEPATSKWMHKPKLALTLWLWRNKAYTFRYWFSADVSNPPMVYTKYGNPEARRFGLSYYFVTLKTQDKTYFEFKPMLGLYFIRLYFRIGWKVTGMSKYIDENGYLTIDTSKTNRLIFTGITPRTNDYDDK